MSPDIAELSRELRTARTPAEKLKLLSGLSAATFHSDRAQARRHSAQALSLARRIGDGVAAANAANVLADIARLDGRGAQAIRYARAALELARQAHDNKGEADSLNSLGLIYWHRGECDRAIKFFTECLDRSAGAGNELVQARAFNNLSLVNWEKGDLAAAMEYQQRSLDLRLRRGDRYDIGISQLNLGLIYCDTGDWDRAIECYYRALVELEKHGDATDVALCYNNLGEVHLRRNKLDKAQEMLETAIGKADEAPSPWVKAEALGNLGELYFRQGDLLRARDCYEQDIGLSSGMADKEELAETWRRMAELLLRTGETDAAREALATARKLTGRTGVRREIGNVWRVTGNLLAASGEIESARDAFEKGRVVFDELGSSYELARFELDCGRALGRFGDREPSLRLLHQAEETFSRLGAPYELEAARLAIAALDATREKTAPLAEKLLDLAAHATSSLELGTQVLSLLKDSFGYEPSESRKPAPATGFSRAIVGAESTLRGIMDAVRQVAPTRACVLIRGESGTGKELIARAIHQASDRADQPFVAINCAAIPETLLESELFGIEKGTATGVSERKGRFETAQGGTVFLDEVGDMSLALQAKFLRVLQEREIERVGGRKTVPVDIRVIAATNRDLDAAIREGKFREDLFYRLNVVPILLPPLRERRSDIALLARYFADKYAREYRRQPVVFSPSTLELLSLHSWPGNVRELENVIERAVVLARGEMIAASDLPPAIHPAGPSAQPDFRTAKVQARSDASTVEKDFLVQTLNRFDWNLTQAAEHLKLSRRHLYRLIEKYGIVRGK